MKYYKGEIEEIPTGWSIDIMDPDGDVVATLDYVMYKGQLYRPTISTILNQRADTLLSHLNRE